MYRFLLWLVPTVKTSPRRQESLRGDRLQATALDALEAGQSSAALGSTWSRRVPRRRRLTGESGAGYPSRRLEGVVPAAMHQGAQSRVM